jgi:quinol monooxygenase YgiN
MSTERIVIVGYKPFPGKEDALKMLMKDHVATLRKEGLASSREPILMVAKSGTIIEVFGWKSKEAIEAAHKNSAVQKMWGQYAEVCEYVPIASLEEASSLFSEFTSLD